MNARNLTILSLIAVAALATGVYLANQRAPEDTFAAEGGLLFEGLDARLNAVSEMNFGPPDAPVATLTRGDSTWQVRQAGDYPANTGEVRQYLLTLAEATRLERKTASAERLGALGLAEQGEDSATRLSLTFEDGSSQAVLVGNAARGATGTYVRDEGELQSWLASGDFSPKQAALDWIEKQFLDFDTNRMQQITITHADGEVLRLSKATRDDPNFFVADVPADQELQYDSVANPIGAALTNVRLQDVSPALLEPAAPSATTIVYESFDGIVITVRAWQAGERNLSAFDVTFSEALAARFQQDPIEAEITEGVASATDEAAQTEATAAAIDGFRAEAEALDARLDGWTYEITSYKYEQITRRMADLLKAETDADG